MQCTRYCPRNTMRFLQQKIRLSTLGRRTWAQRIAGREEEVAGLDVAVQDAGGVAGAQQPQNFPHRHCRMPLAQRAARLGAAEKGFDMMQTARVVEPAPDTMHCWRRNSASRHPGCSISIG